MKIAFFVSKFPALSETFILDQITGLIARGHEVEIFADHAGSDRLVQPEVEAFRLRERIHCNSHRNGGGLLAKARGLIALRRPASRNGGGDFDAILCHFGCNGLRAAELRRHGAIGGKLATVFHAHDVSRYLRKHGEHAYDALFADGDLFLPVSEHWRERLIELGCDPGKTFVHRMGVDCGIFRRGAAAPAGGGRIRIASVSRLVEKKGLEMGIAAVAELLKVHPGIEYHIIGNGPLRERLERAAAARGAAGAVRFHGEMTRGGIARFLETADIFLAPSRTAASGDQEGIPVGIMEAMAMSLPVVSTRHSGIPELVRDGASGLLAPEGDARALAESLARLIADPALRLEMGRAGRRIAEAMCDIEALNDRLADLLQGLSESRA